MPRLIEISKAVEQQVTHRECGAVIGYFPNEVQDGGIYEDYGGNSERLFYIICPNCGHKLTVKRF